MGTFTVYPKEQERNIWLLYAGEWLNVGAGGSSLLIALSLKKKKKKKGGTEQKPLEILASAYECTIVYIVVFARWF